MQKECQHSATKTLGPTPHLIKWYMPKPGNVMYDGGGEVSNLLYDESLKLVRHSWLSFNQLRPKI